ncbi:TPA: hypothetical protein MEL26_005281 [Klebsiella quasipneumoniae subsp. quasipneumoniae]|nr:hypothetical protein [Klebsiella quasipneumoniae subsp. quasipneumoniae]
MNSRQQSGESVKKTAGDLGVSISALYSWVKKSGKQK